MFAFRRQALLATAAAVVLCALASSASIAQQPDAAPPADDGKRLTLKDLKPGTALDGMPEWLAFRNYACGSNGGPPLRKLAGWQEFNLCKPDANGLYEVYFEYDNEAEYILRALDDPRTVRFVGTTEQGFPIIASALFSEDGVLRGLRMVTDPRADYTADQFFDLTNLRSRNDFYLLGPFVGGQVHMSPTTDCVNLPAAEGETPVAGRFVKIDCERVEDGLHYLLKTRYFRKPGQHARDPRTGELTEGQYESSTVFEEYELGYGPSDGAGSTPAPAATK